MARNLNKTAHVIEQKCLLTVSFRSAFGHKQTLEIRVPAARDFVPLHLGSMPIAAAFNGLSDLKKDRLVSDVEEALSGYIQDNRLVYRDSVNVVTGYK